MGEVTGITWTDHTFNPWWGCTRVSPGCDHCYAETFDKRCFPALAPPAGIGIDPVVVAEHWGKGAPRRTFGAKHWQEPLKWNRAAEKEGRRHRVFCASMADVMDDEAPAGVRERLWELIDSTPWLIWQLLTKRPHRYAEYLPAKFALGNVWLGVTAEDQRFYDVRWPLLLEACARMNALSWISYEPALGPLSLAGFPVWPRWVIFGGESGHGRRECSRAWADSLLAEIREYQPEVKLFVKQMSAQTPAIGKSLIPAELLIQEFPAD